MASNVNANFNYNANFGPVINQMRQLMTQANLLNQTLQNFDKQASGLKLSLGDSLASDIGKMGGWNTKVIELSDSVGQFGKALQKQELSLKQYAKEGIGAFSTASNAHKLAVREVAREMSQLAILGEKNGKQMGMMITPANINLKDFNTNLAVSRKQFDIFNTIVQDGATKLINFGKNTQWAGRQITVGLTVPLVTWGNQVSKIFRDVNVELTRFQKVYGSGLMSSGDAETLKMTEHVKQLGIEFSQTMGIAVKDTASLAAELAATGLEGQKLLNALKETTRLATLGDVSNADAMKTTLSLTNAFKIKTDELAHSVDFLNAVENQTSLSLSDLTTAIPKAGPVIKALGGDVKDLSLLMVALKEGGISAAEGANAVKSGMASLINPTKKASDTAKQYGIDINQIVQANRGQLMPTIMEFQKQLQLLDDFGKAKVIENVFGKYQFARMSALFDNLNASSSQTMQVMELMGKSQKELAANSYLEMDTLMNSGAKRFQRATESIKSQFIDIGGSITSAITPIIENISTKIGRVIKFFEKLPAPVKSFIKVAVGLTAIAGPIIMIAGVFSNFLGYITKGAMSIVNLGRRMSGIPVEKFKMLDDTQLMAQKSTDALSQAFDIQKTSVEKLNSVLAVYKKHLGDAITLNPNFVNVQVAQQTTTGNPPVPKFQKGGQAWVPGSGDGDKVPAMLEPGEFVVNKKAAAQNAGLLHDINFNQAPRFQSGGRIGSAAGGLADRNAGDYPPQLKDLVSIWQQGPKGIRNHPEKLDALMSFFYPIRGTKTLRRKTTLGVPGEMPESQQLAIMAALESGNYEDIIGKRFNLKGKPSAYTEWGFDWLASKEFTGDPQKIEFARQNLDREQRGLKTVQLSIEALHNAADPMRQDMSRRWFEDRFRGWGERGRQGASEENIAQLVKMYTDGIRQSEADLAKLLPYGVDPMDIMIQRQFKPGSRMLDVTRVNPDEKYRGNKLMEREWLASPGRPQLESVSQAWLPPEKYIGGQRGYDQGKTMMPYVLNMKQRGGSISSAEGGLKGKPDMAIFDIDRTLADTADFAHAFKFGDISEWAKLTAGAPVIQRELQRLLLEKQSGKQIGLLTARSSEMDAMTLGWLAKNKIPYDKLWSRPPGDQSKDSAFKHQLLQQIMQRYNVTGLYDDKRSNLKAAESLGITGIQAFMTDKVQSAEVGLSSDFYSAAPSELVDLIDNVLPKAIGSNAQEISQINMLRSIIEQYKVANPDGEWHSSIPFGIRAAVYDMFGVHRSKQKNLQSKKMGEFQSANGLQINGPGTYLSPTLKESKKWSSYSGDELYKIIKTNDKFVKTIKGNGYVPDDDLPQVIKEWNEKFAPKGKEIYQQESSDNFFGPTSTAHSFLAGISPDHPFFKWMISQGHEGIDVNFGSELINWKIGTPGIKLSGIQSAEGGMPQKYADKQAAIEQMLALAHLEATTGRFASMPVTDIGQRQSGMGGFSSAIPGVNGVYEINGQKFIVKGHNTLDSALIESRGTQLTQGMFGLTTPEQELIKLAHPETGQQMFGVRSPFDARFAQTSGQIAPDAFFKQALAAIIRGDADLQADNLFDGIVTDVGAGYVSDRASQPRTLSGKKNDVETQARINFLMQKGGARRWFAEATAGLAASMTPEQYEAGFLNAIAEAQANAGGAIGALQNLTPEEKAMYELLQGDLSAASKIDWRAIHAHHAGVTPEPVKPKSEPTAKALEKKAAEAAEREQALKAGFPAWMQSGGMVSSAAGGINTMFYGTGHGIKKASAPKDWKEAIYAGLNSKLVQKRSSNARKLGIGNSDRIEIAHTKSDVYKKVFGQNAKQWDGTEIFEVGLINNMLNMLDGTGVVGKFANKWMGNAAHVQPDSISEGNRLFKALGNAVQHLGDKDAPQGGSKNWISGAYKFLSNPENINYYGQKIKINDFIRGSVSPLQTLSEDVPKNLRDKITSKQLGGRVNNFDSNSMVVRNQSWKKRASAPKQYESVLRGLPDWATKGAEAQAILAALQSAGIENPDRLMGYYMQDVLAHINPATTNTGEVYTKIWEAANIMKDSQAYNSFLETIRSRKDIQNKGGLLAPHVIQGVMAYTGLPENVVREQLTKLNAGVHPDTRQGAMTMMALAKMFPQPAKAGRGLPIGVAAGLEARLKGNFYETLQSRALPSGLPTVKVTSVNDDLKTAQSRRGSGLPGAPTMPKIIYPSMAGGGSRISATGATVNVSPDGKILSNTIDDMLVTSASGHPLAVSSRELLAVTPEGTIAGVTSPGDESRKRIVHPMGTSLIRGKNFKARSAAGGMGDTSPVYEGEIASGSMAKFAASISSMVGVVGQLQYAFSTFTAEVQNGTQKWIAGIELTATSLQMFADNGMGSLGAKLKQRGDVLSRANDIYGNGGAKGKLVGVGSKAMSGIGSAMGKVAGALGNPLVQIGLQVGIAAINKSIEIYNKEMEKARAAGNAAFKEPTETAKLMGVQLKSLTNSTEKYSKASKNIFGEQGKGAYDKAFEKTVKTDYGDLIDVLKTTGTLQEKNNQLTNVYSNLIQRGMDPKNAKELTAEIARQGQSLDSFSKISSDLGGIKTPKDAMKAQLGKLKDQMDLLEQKRKLATSVSFKDALQGGVQVVPGIGQVAGQAGKYIGGASKGQQLRADTVNKAIFGGNQDKWWAHALTGTGLDRNPFVQVLGGWLADKKIKEQMAAQLGGTLKAAFGIAAENPTASNEAIAMIVKQFKDADWGKVTGELSKILEEKGFGATSALNSFVTSETANTNGVLDSFKEANNQQQQQILSIINTGGGQELEKAINDGKLTPKVLDKLAGKAAKTQALVKIDAEVDIQLEDSKKQLEGLKTAVQKVFETAIEAKQAELDVEDKRHQKALDNLDEEAKKIGAKKDLLQENTDYYIKELQKESEAQDYYAKQRDTALGGLKSLASGDVFGFIGAQQQAANQSDQFGRDRSMQNIQDTADEEQKKLDNALKGIDDKKAAEDARHQSEMDNINAEIEALKKKESVTVGSINKALDLIDKAEAMQPGDKGYDKAVRAANTAAEQAGIAARVNTSGIELPAGTDKDLVKSFNSAKGELKDSLQIMADDTVDAVDRLNDASEIASNVFKSLGIDPKHSAAYKSVFDTLQKPMDPTVKDTVEMFVYGKVDNATGMGYTPPKTPKKPKSDFDPNAGDTSGATGTSFGIAPVGATIYTRAGGGTIYGAGTATSDSIPAMLSNGEFVMNAASVKKYGVPMMNAINAGKYANGGGVGVMPRTSVPNSPTYSVPSTPSVSPASIAEFAGGGYAEGNTNSPTYHFNFNGAGMDMVMGHVNKAMGGTINNNSRGVYC